MIEPALLDALGEQGQAGWADRLRRDSAGWLVGHGDYPRWRAALDALPPIAAAEGYFDRPEVTVVGDCEDTVALRAALEGLIPWRKGPFRVADVSVDAEWRSDIKWARIAPALEDLRGRRVLDIGCGNGYYCWRMLAGRPSLVLGIDPSVLFNLQYRAIRRYLPRDDIHLLPIGVEALPADMGWFDTVFSMGVLYHRRSPIDHLLRLRSLLRPGGELCLETLVVAGGAGRVLVPRARYARMRNVWFIPSALELENWLRRSGFERVRLLDESPTTTAEQRSTGWMRFESLAECLDPADPGLTVEGYPAPSRAVFLARAPG